MPSLNEDQFSGQLRMFAPAHEIKAAIDAGNLHTGDDELETGKVPMSQMWRIKRREAQWEGTHKSVQEEGVKTPLHIFHDPEGEEQGSWLWDGHHRLISAYDKDPNAEIPLKYNDEPSYESFLNNLGTSKQRSL